MRDDQPTCVDTPSARDRRGGIGPEQLWRHGHDYVFPSQFMTVEPGRIFRGPGRNPGRSARLFATIRSRPSSPWLIPPTTTLPSRNSSWPASWECKWIHIPIVDHRGTNDRAAEDAISDLLDQAAAVLADPANHPIFFHCHHGLNRTSMVQIAYRTKYCGWTFDASRR